MNDEEADAELRRRLDVLAETQPRIRDLERALLLKGGRLLVPRVEPDLDAILDHGELFVPSKVVLVRGRTSQCHANVARLYKRNKKIGVVTGYALSKDGLWRQHSWALAPDGTIIETTIPRLLYVGVVLSPARAKAFVEANI